MKDNLELFLTLTATSGRICRANLTPMGDQINWKPQGWPCESDDPTVEARFVITDESVNVVHHLVIKVKRGDN